MKLSFLLVIGLIAAAHCAARQDKPEKQASESQKRTNESSSSRRGRFFFLGNLLTGPAALASAGANSVGKSFISLSKTLGSIGHTATEQPNVIYVTRECRMPFFTKGCPHGHVCASVSPGGTRCVPQSPDGFPCFTGFQCISNTCRDKHCMKDECSTVGEGSGCPRGQTCVATPKGRRCQSQPDANECPRPLTTSGCEKNQYCTTGAKGNICTDKLPVNSICTDPIECLSGTCRSSKCKADACPVIDMSIDCMPMQYCSPGEKGNMCVAKKENGVHCSASRQCKSNVCERGICVQDQCPHPYMTGRCLPSQFCSPAPSGNMCMEKRGTNGMCHLNEECMSNTCRNRRCVANQCQTPFSTDGCNMMTQYCMSTTNGNQCVTRRAIGRTCLVPNQCLSDNCVSGICAPGASAGKANGASCGSPSECSSTFCVLGTCAANKMSLGGRCFLGTDCQSMSCTNAVCVESSTTTVATTVTTTDASATTTTATTAATTTTAAALLVDGTTCAMASECMSMRCINSICTPALVGIGAMCNVNSECLSNNCNANACALGTVAAGAPCTDGSQCASSECTEASLCV